MRTSRTFALRCNHLQVVLQIFAACSVELLARRSKVIEHDRTDLLDTHCVNYSNDGIQNDICPQSRTNQKMRRILENDERSHRVQALAHSRKL
jgi:hypothetical protein